MYAKQVWPLAACAEPQSTEVAGACRRLVQHTLTLLAGLVDRHQGESDERGRDGDGADVTAVSRASAQVTEAAQSSEAGISGYVLFSGFLPKSLRRHPKSHAGSQCSLAIFVEVSNVLPTLGPVWESSQASPVRKPFTNATSRGPAVEEHMERASLGNALDLPRANLMGMIRSTLQASSVMDDCALSQQDQTGWPQL